jgi:hypothetical protein
MKKLLLIGLILAILILAMPQGVLAADTATSKDVAVTANLQSYSGLTVDTNSITWPLVRGPNTLGSDAAPCITVTVDSNIAYKVQANADKAGLMTDSGLNAYTAPLNLHGVEGVWTFTSGTPQTIVANGVRGDAVASGYSLSQAIDNDDSADNPHTITLTFELAPL